MEDKIAAVLPGLLRFNGKDHEVGLLEEDAPDD
jgi:hypothetical protein